MLRQDMAQAAIDQTALEIYWAGLDGRLVEVNTTVERLTGEGRERLIGQPVASIDTSLDAAAWSALVARLRQVRHERREGVHRRVEGEECAVEVTLSLLECDGQPLVCAFALEIGPRSAVEMALRESEQRLRSLINATPDIICFKDGEGRWLEANDADLALFSLTAVDYRGRTDAELAEFTDPCYRDAFLACESSDEIAWRAGRLSRAEERITRPDGVTKVYDVIKVPVFEDDGRRKGLIVLGRDITERDCYERALRDSEERFALAMRGSDAGLFDWDLRTRRIYLSARWKSMLGYAERQLPDRLETWERLVDPRDRERCWRRLRDYMSGRCDDFDLEMRMRHKEGHWVDVLSRAYLVRDQRGRALRMVGTQIDISALKQAQRQAETERNRARQYLDIAGVMFLALDLDGHILSVNPRGCNVLGCAESELIGLDWFARFLPPGERERRHGLFRKMLSGAHPETALTDGPILTARGEERLIAWHHNLVRDGEGTVIGTLSSGEDVTERRLAERALHEERAFLQHVIDGIDDPIMVIGTDHHVLRMNRVAQRLAAVDDAGLHEWGCHQLAPHPCVPEDPLCPLRTILESGEPCKMLRHHRLPDGGVRQYEVAASPLLDDTGEVIGIIEVSRDISDHLELLDRLRERENSYAHLAHHDPLTGLPNRLLFADRLEQAIRLAHREHTRLAVLFIDLDGFKHVNDSFDHSYGDQVLKVVAGRLRAQFREGDTLARMGGDEFTLILNGIAHQDDAARVARAILQLFKDPFEVGEHSVFLGASIGISLYPEHGARAEDLVRNADAAMYRAKDEGRNGFRYYSEELTARAFERVLLESSLHRALERDELELFYQPQLDLVSGELRGLEALVRWRHPEMGLVSPGKFIPLAEESGIIIVMGEWILEHACTQMRAWQQGGLLDEQVLISVNLSPKQFDQHALSEMVGGILTRTGLSPAGLELEITESTMMRSIERTRHVLGALRALGVKIAIDDFGTGYSSLTQLKRLPLTKLKIDKSFVSDIPDDANDVAIAKAIIALASSLSLEVLAEGVETREQQDFLTREGCHTGQGYLFSHPLEVAALERFLLALRGGG
ncbi:diguanylate cyclase [Marichromatium purpuratum 984]|uniref:cyclic-guanylate-specific phosphodiesterase n=1 Tax=Marichromatium purpuratum 984 TaxID=765910 RepID=W0DVH2_MARPU|nr:EAL domain-containing protein [Marichromatium purpuratum]AHF02442.1 diguanylate cyclase [Marichromatium purpuratum 984]